VDDLTKLLNGSDPQASAKRLLPVVYGELRKLAARKMDKEAPGHTLQATALVHEAWLRVGNGAHEWQSRAHFFSSAAEAMRRILIDRARRKRALRHGGGMERLDVLEMDIEAPAPDEEMLRVDEALDRFAQEDPQKAELVKLRYFVGLTIEETAEVLDISVATAKRHWTYSRAWLFRELTRSSDAS
jgi:RNA polymerase sigma factor (TIGR02999 family)